MKGFTLIELIVTISVVVTLLAFTAPSLLTSQRRTDLNETLNVLVSDVRQQQSQAMLRYTATVGAPSDFGIYFDTNGYTLFKGLVYVASDSGNFSVVLSPQMVFDTITFPNSQIVFASGTGESKNFTADTYELSLSDTQEGVTKIITVNRYGVITSVN
jgi:prepilin-type N-terminal cleavage/methylation domain-containing protein